MLNINNSAPTVAADPKAMEQFQGDKSSPEALQAAATQFESMLIEEVLKSMRSATDVLADDSLMNRDKERFYQNMYDSQLAFEMASTGTLGIAEQLMEQALKQHPPQQGISLEKETG